MMLENILADFELLDDWEDRYRYVIELGRSRLRCRKRRARRRTRCAAAGRVGAPGAAVPPMG